MPLASIQKCRYAYQRSENQAMKHVSTHYHGEKVVLDEPVSLSTNTPVEVVIPDSIQDLERVTK